MVQRVSITITCSDQIGLLATITGRLFDLNADLGNTNFSVRKKIAEFNSVAEFKNLLDEKVIVLELNKLPGLENAQINISEYHPTIKKENQLQITYSVELRGEDRPGLPALGVGAAPDGHDARLRPDRANGSAPRTAAGRG